MAIVQELDEDSAKAIREGRHWARMLEEHRDEYLPRMFEVLRVFGDAFEEERDLGDLVRAAANASAERGAEDLTRIVVEEADRIGDATASFDGKRLAMDIDEGGSIIEGTVSNFRRTANESENTMLLDLANSSSARAANAALADLDGEKSRRAIARSC